MRKLIFSLLVVTSVRGWTQTDLKASGSATVFNSSAFDATSYSFSSQLSLPLITRFSANIGFQFDYFQPQFSDWNNSLFHQEIFRKSIVPIALKLTAKKWDFTLQIQTEWNSYNQSGTQWNQMLGNLHVARKLNNNQSIGIGIQRNTLYGKIEYSPFFYWKGNYQSWTWTLGFPASTLTKKHRNNSYNLTVKQFGERYQLGAQGFQLTHTGNTFSFSTLQSGITYEHQFDRYFSVAVHTGLLTNSRMTLWNANQSTVIAKSSGWLSGITIKFK